ncbi:MAG: beta-ketoacyl-[acyl-carrier-protein] synthase family protein [Phycisphaerae bacterium]|jgi:3-oxoacyl-[acyl-carrier-protein] synthase II
MGNERRVVVTGLGVATPIGIGPESFWEALLQKQCGLRRIEDFDPSGLPAQIAGELPAFSLRDYIPKTYRKSAKVMSRDIQIAVVSAYHAVKDAGLGTKCLVERGEAPDPPNVDSRRFGANIGAGLICADLPELAGALSTSADENRKFSLEKWGAEGMNNLTPLWLLKFLPNMLACHVTIVHDAQAPSNTITCGEASSHIAIGEAYRTIARGDADVCICGGAESKVNPMAMIRPWLFGWLNGESNNAPENAIEPFGAASKGTAAAEGGGLVILESLDHARERNARIYVEVAGFGAGTNVQSWSKPDKKGRGIALSIRNALSDAGTTSSDVDLVAPFGTGITSYDQAETAAWTDVFGDRLAEVPAMVTRGAVGNNGAGSGAIDFAAAVMALYHNTVPPSLNTDTLASDCTFQFVHGDPVDAKITQAVSVGTALIGGQSAALVIREYRE